jgi:hypothetical protein
VKVARLSALSRFDPAGDVAGVVLTRFKGEVKIGTEEGCSEFGREFFHRVAFGAETLAALGGDRKRGNAR